MTDFADLSLPPDCKEDELIFDERDEPGEKALVDVNADGGGLIELP